MPRVDWYFEGLDAYLTISVFNKGTDALDNTLFEFEIHLMLTEHTSGWLDWLLPYRHYGKGWCAQLPERPA